MNAALLMIVDGRFPAGGHTYSAGVEAAVAVHDVTDEHSLERYLAGRLATTGLTDAAFSSHVCAQLSFDAERLRAADLEYDARTLSPALRVASRRFGRQLLRAAHATWKHPAIEAARVIDGGAHQPIALGAVVAAAGGTPHEASLVSLHHLAAAVTSSAVRLLGLDPLAVAALQARAAGAIDALALSASTSARSDACELPAQGGSLTDILSEDHHRWDSRLFVA